MLDCFTANYLAQTPPLVREDTSSTPLDQTSFTVMESVEQVGAQGTLGLSILTLSRFSIVLQRQQSVLRSLVQNYLEGGKLRADVDLKGKLQDYQPPL